MILDIPITVDAPRHPHSKSSTAVASGTLSRNSTQSAVSHPVPAVTAAPAVAAPEAVSAALAKHAALAAPDAVPAPKPGTNNLHALVCMAPFALRSSILRSLAADGFSASALLPPGAAEAEFGATKPPPLATSASADPRIGRSADDPTNGTVSLQSFEAALDASLAAGLQRLRRARGESSRECSATDDSSVSECSTSSSSAAAAAAAPADGAPGWWLAPGLRAEDLRIVVVVESALLLALISQVCVVPLALSASHCFAVRHELLAVNSSLASPRFS